MNQQGYYSHEYGRGSSENQRLDEGSEYSKEQAEIPYYPRRASEPINSPKQGAKNNPNFKFFNEKQHELNQINRNAKNTEKPIKRGLFHKLFQRN